MTSKERVLAALTFREVDRVPQELWMLPGVSMFRRPELEEVMKQYPSDFYGVSVRYGASPYAKGNEYTDMTYTDAWGCTFMKGEPGVIGEVVHPPIQDKLDYESYKIPWSLLTDADISHIGAECEGNSKFTRAGTQVRPFERLQFLRGSETLFLDMAEENPIFLGLKEKIHEFNLREFELLSKTPVESVMFLDDWGSQNALLISPDMWRHYFKPMYQAYAEIARGAGKFVFFHSDGNIESIYPDLIEIGINAVNSQLFCMDIEKLGRKYAGKITFWGEICRQRILPFGTPQDVSDAVDRVAQHLFSGRTGCIAQCEWGLKDPKANIEMVYRRWSSK